jgi:uncharacterized protein DUF742
MADTRGHHGRAVTPTPPGSDPDDPPVSPTGTGSDLAGLAVDDRWELQARVIRPYILTGGRTRPAAPTLAVETMLEASENGWDWSAELPLEQRLVVELCTQPLSVAEVAARLTMPLGVVRVLVAEMVDTDMLHVFGPAPDLAADVALLQRLIARVKAIPA